MITPTALAHLALLLWPAIVLLLFSQLPPLRAAAIAFTLAPMLLPKRLGYDVPGLPPIDRVSICCIAVAIACAVFARSRFRVRRPLTGIDGLMVIIILSCVLSTLTNADSLPLPGGGRLCGLALYDSLSLISFHVIYLGIPFVVGRVLIDDPSEIRVLLAIVAAAALIYTLPILWELRMSPQLHRIFYGFQPARFAQHVRSGGYRPMVFIGHGLTLSLFLCVATLSAATLWKARSRILGVPAIAVTAYLLIILVASKGRAALAIAVALVPVVYFFKSKRRVWVAGALALLVLAYPTMRATGTFPVQTVLDASGSLLGEERRDSLAIRFDTEQVLLERLRERPLFGWAGWGRNTVYDESGQSLVVFDGYWIIILGEQGYFGFFAVFSLLLLPIFAAARALKYRRSSREGTLLSGLACIVAVYAVNLLPNSSLPPLAVFLSGALAGACESAARPPVPHRRRPRFRRAALERQTEGSPAPASSARELQRSCTTKSATRRPGVAS